MFNEFREVNWEGDPPVPVAGGGVSGSGNVTKGSVRSASSDPFVSLWKVNVWREGKNLDSLRERRTLYNIIAKNRAFYE